VGALWELKYGKSLPEKTRQAGDFGVYGSNGPVGTHIEPLTSGPTIILGRKGSIGELHFSAAPCFPIDTTYFIDDFSGCDAGFVAWLMRSLPLKTMNRATAIPGLSREDAYGLDVPVPPAAEQRRIVAKLDALTARTARARADLDRIPALAVRYKQAVLAKIFGELDCEPEKLIDLVDPARGIPYGIVQTGVPVPSGVPTVRCGDVRQFSVEKEGLKIVSQDIADAYARTRLRGGEVLLAIRGSVGNSAVVGPELAGCNISREVALIPVVERLRPRFAMLFLGSPEAQSYLKRHVKGVAQTGINLEDVRSLTLPVPELAVQDAVIERIDRALVEIDRLAGEAACARRLLDRLDQAVLAKAFRGELVPQDPADEPAGVLLDRIRAERVAAPKATRGRRKAVA
jgi:type I restriction enzyme S subunit